MESKMHKSKLLRLKLMNIYIQKRLYVQQFIDSRQENIVGRLNMVSIKMHIFHSLMPCWRK